MSLQQSAWSKAYFTVTKADLFNFVVRIYMNKGMTKDEACLKILEFSKKMTKARKHDKANSAKAK